LITLQTETDSERVERAKITRRRSQRRNLSSAYGKREGGIHSKKKILQGGHCSEAFLVKLGRSLCVEYTTDKSFGAQKKNK